MKGLPPITRFCTTSTGMAGYSILCGLYCDARQILSMTNSSRPMVDRKYDNPMELFSFLAYQKGSWVLHMLRAQLGKDLYRRCILTYLERHQFGSVVTED